MRRLLCLFAAITCLAVSDGQFQTHQIAGTDLHEKVVEWLKRENIDDSDPAIAIQIAKFLYSVFEGVDQYHSVVPTAFDDQVSEECLEESKSYLDHLKRSDPFALQMQQSNGEIHLFTAGMGTYGLGKFDDCLNVKAMVNITKGTETREKLLRGRFCDVSFRPVELNESEIENGIDQLGGNPITLFEFLALIFREKITPIDSGETGLTTDFNFLDPRYLPTGFCVPSACTSKDVRHAVARLVGSHALPNIFGLNSRLARIVTYSSDDYCVAEDDPRKPFSAADIAVISILSVIGFLVASATLHELVRMHFFSPIDTNTESMEVRVLHCFSAVNNTRKLLTTRPSSDNLGCVHGIRVLSTTWVVMGHTYFMLLFTPVVTNITLGDALQKWQTQTIVNATVSVDSFFLLSGMLVSYLLLRELERNKGRFNPFLFYLHRYLRITPVYAIIIGFVATLLYYVGSGPIWGSVRGNMDLCRNGWWKNLLYINNFYEERCTGESWYLACDMQLFIFSPLFIYPLWQWKWMGTIFPSLAILASLIAGIVVWALGDYSLGVIGRLDYQDPHYETMIYQNTGLRAPPYLLGIILGFILHTTKNKQIKLNKLFVAVMWITSFAIGLSVVYGLVPYTDMQKVPVIKKSVTVAYGSLHRTAWALALSWVVFACIKGYGGIINSILSWRAFEVLGRLTYCVYLLHLELFEVYLEYMRQLLYYTTFTHTVYYFGMLTIVFLLAFFVSVTIEAPLMNLEKLIFSPNQKKRPDQVKLMTPQVTVSSPVGIANPTFNLNYGTSHGQGIGSSFTRAF